MRYRLKDLLWRVRFWWSNRWFKRNRIRLRNVAAWAVHHQAFGGSYDANEILKGHADRRISEAAYGRISKLAPAAVAGEEK